MNGGPGKKASVVWQAKQGNDEGPDEREDALSALADAVGAELRDKHQAKAALAQARLCAVQNIITDRQHSTLVQSINTEIRLGLSEPDERSDARVEDDHDGLSLEELLKRTGDY